MFISVRNSSKTASELMFNKSAFIHRKNKKSHVRFNPSFKEFIGERGIAYKKDGNKVLLAISDNYDWKLSKSANMKASTFTDLLDLVYHKNTPKTNRYKLSYVETTDDGDIFEIVPAEEVAEREISEELRQAAAERLNAARMHRVANTNQISIEG